MEKLLMEQPDIADVFEHNGHTFCVVEKGLKTELFDLTRAEMDCRVSSAKGFSNGYAAVANEDGLWGFIDSEGNLIVNQEFYNVGYFTPEENCIVSRTEGALGILHFAYR